MANWTGTLGFRSMILVWMSVQNSLHTIFMRYSRSRNVERMYLPSVAVFWMEIFKLCVCVIAVCLEEMSLNRFVFKLKRSIIDHPMDTLKVCIPSFVYTISNNLFYVSATYLDAATFAITSQLKLLTTAVFSVIILRKSLNRRQWISLLILFTGVSMVQWPSSTIGSNRIDSNRINSTRIDPKTADRLFGFTVAVFASVLAGFAGVYFERILKSRDAKSTDEISVWLRNIQLSISSVPIALITAYLENGDVIGKYGLLYGFDWIVWITVSWAGIGGLSVAICIKYTDNIRKNFATSMAIILSTVLSVWIFQFRPSIYFLIGAALVISAIFLYTKSGSVDSKKLLEIGKDISDTKY